MLTLEGLIAVLSLCVGCFALGYASRPMTSQISAAILLKSI